MKKNSKESRQKILRAAENIFAEKGFDGARVDAIARTARVNKALIYYYFKSKKAILDELIGTFVKESTILLFKYIAKGGLNPPGNDPIPTGEPVDELISFYEENQQILRIMMVESIKNSSSIPPIFNLVDLDEEEIKKTVPNYEQILTDLETLGLHIEEGREQYMVIEFFTSIIPSVCYSIFKEQWCKHFKITKDRWLKKHGVKLLSI